MPPRSKAEREAEAFRLPHLVEPDELELPPPPEPPERLSPTMKRWWTTVTHTYVLESHHQLLLEAAADSWDLMTQARETVRREGLTVPTGNGGTKKNPACDIELHNKIAFARLVRELDLDDMPVPADKHVWRPPPIKSNR
jgi:phage terminase small subunit